MAEPSASESSADSDQDFDPTAEMLVNDFDDEHTLDEEEALESAESVSNELDDLQREGEIPIEELLAMYGYGASESSNNELKEPAPRPPTPPQFIQPPEKVPSPPPPVDERENSPVVEDTPDNQQGSGPLLRCKKTLLRCKETKFAASQVSESSETGTDDDYSPDDDWRKTIQVGSDYQAVIPEGLCKYDDAPAYENEDRLLWDPTKLSDQEVDEYLRHSQQPHPGCAQGVNAIPVGSHIRDDEQALFLLLQCGHNVEEALRRRRMQPLHPADTMSLWSEDECRSFENGLRTYGKDFHMVQQNKVRTRSVGELVQFYYLWKKTERHDVFASKNRLEKKKYALHPGTTDYMDRFLDEQENPPAHRDRSSSPSMHSLIFGENKKRTPSSSPHNNSSKTDSLTDPAYHQDCSHQSESASQPFGGTNSVYPVGSEKNVCLPSSSDKTHLSVNQGDFSKDFLNGTMSSISKDRGTGKLIASDLQSLRVENITNHTSIEKSPHNPPTDIVMCSRHSIESRLHDSHSDTCGPRFESRREEVTIE